MSETTDEFVKRVRNVCNQPKPELTAAAPSLLPEALDRLEQLQAELAKARQEEREACARMAEQTPAYSCPFAANWAGPPPETEELCPVCGQDKDGHGGKCVGESSAVALAMAIRARSESDD